MRRLWILEYDLLITNFLDAPHALIKLVLLTPPRPRCLNRRLLRRNNLLPLDLLLKGLRLADDLVGHDLAVEDRVEAFDRF